MQPADSLFLSGRISEVCQEKGTQKQLGFVPGQKNLVMKLTEARKNGTLEKLLRELRSLELLLLNEWGDVPVDKDGSQLLFRVISDSYESKSLILTMNREFSKWGGIFTDDQMAAAMIDRLVHHGHLLIFEGKSYRMEHALLRRDA